MLDDGVLLKILFEVLCDTWYNLNSSKFRNTYGPKCFGEEKVDLY